MNPSLKTAAGKIDGHLVQSHTDCHFPKRPDMTWHEHLVLLLKLGVALEHNLMVQYLFAAYSLGGEQVPPDQRPMVTAWRNDLISVAREEMGHLLTVQNVLTLLGSGFTLDHHRFPWPVVWYDLAPFTLKSAACFTFAEMPETDFPLRETVVKLANKHIGKNSADAHPVAEVYNEILKIIGDPRIIPDSAFNADTYRFQASWDEWGRGYGPPIRRLDAEGNICNPDAMKQQSEQVDCDLLILPVATRTQAESAIRRVSEQGEGLSANQNAGELTHFRRLINIFAQYKAVKEWSPARNVATNPNTFDDKSEGFIAHKRTQPWADLFNLRYRLLLTFLMHTYQVAPAIRPEQPNVRSMLMHRIFGEMYQLKAIASRLVRMPLRDVDADPNTPSDQVRFAGPPFQLPYNLHMPAADADCWRSYADIFKLLRNTYEAILDKDGGEPTKEERLYIHTLIELDAQAVSWIRTILAGLSSETRYR